MTTIYKARWLLPVSNDPIEYGALAIENGNITAVGSRDLVENQYPSARVEDLGNAIIAPGLINAHTHLELTILRGFLEKEEANFFAWLQKLTIARRELMTHDDIFVSAAWGACEAARAGITSVGDASDSGSLAMQALSAVGLRGTVFQESFGPDPRLVVENMRALEEKVSELRTLETELVGAGVSPHAPYTVCGPQLEAIAEYATTESLPLMMHAAESAAEESFIRGGSGIFADGLAKRGIEWRAANVSPIEYLKQRGILRTRPLLAHCIRVNHQDIDSIFESESTVAHCPKSNAKLGHGHAPLGSFIERGVVVGLGSDSVASNNTCDLFEESRFALLLSRAQEDASHRWLTAADALQLMTLGGAKCLGLEEKVGKLQVGLQADLIAISLEGNQQAPSYDPIASTIFSSGARDVVLTVVAGKEVFRDGRVTTQDEERLRARVEELRLKISE